MQKELHIDIETYSPEPIGDTGNYKYAMHPEFEILLCAWAFDNDPVQCFDLAQGDELPQWFIDSLTDETIIKCAHNATFERVCFTMLLRRQGVLKQDEWLDAKQWKCSMIQCARCGLPLSLDQAGAALGITQQKMKEGKALIQLFCTPRNTKSRKISKTIQVADDNPELEKAIIDANLSAWSAGERRDANADALYREAKRLEAQKTYHEEPNPDYDHLTSLFGTDTLPKRVQPSEFPDKWETFKAYCIRDVEAEREIAQNIDWYPVSDFEKNLYAIDQQINDRGVLIDSKLVQNAITIDATYKARLNIEAVKLSGLENPNSVGQLKTWIAEQTGIELTSLNKDDIPDLKKQITDKRVLRILDIRNELRKTSCQKYTAMKTVAGPDWRARGVTQFHGSRTGRWAGRLIQMQNLPQNHIKDLDFARQALLDGDEELIEMGYGNVPDVLSQLIRTAFIAPEGKTLAVCDFSAIEARVIAWMAGEEWVLEVFRNGGDIYCATASNMFKVPVEKHGQNSHLRQKGKIAVLALGYGGGVDALDKMGGQRQGLSRDEEADIVRKWREANPNIVAFWRQLETAAKQVCVTKQTIRVGALTLAMHGTTMTIALPSGRLISYPDMQPCTNRFGNASLKYRGVNQETHKWGWIETYGGKLTENVIQATARDCLAETMSEIADNLQLPIIFHVHDEIICEIDIRHQDEQMASIKAAFAKTPSWAPGLPLNGAGYITPYYKKD